MKYGKFANTYLVGRGSSRLSPDRRSRTVPIGKGPDDPAREKGLYRAYGAFRALLLGTSSSESGTTTSRIETSFASAARKPATHGGKMLN